MLNSQYFESYNGQKSSKRLCLVIGLINWVILTTITTIIFLHNAQYTLTLNLIENIGFTVFGLGGLVASEVFAKKHTPTQDYPKIEEEKQ